ncbi:MAG: hypothetical protein F4Y92_01240 [Dehalococcoidia bacterium]|nr:hypothetical protein [Dehalococcoidia bacterium]
MPALTPRTVASLALLAAIVVFAAVVALIVVCGSPDREPVDERWRELGVAEPEIVFLGDFSEEEQVLFLREIQAAQVLFEERFGIVTSDFTTYLSTTFNSVNAAYTRLYPGDQLYWFPCGGIATDNEIFVVIENCTGWGRANEDVLAHEYFHILQSASGTSLRAIAPWKTWLVEGSADYAMALHSEARGRTTMDDRRFGARYGWSDIGEPLPRETHIADLLEDDTWKLVYQVGFLAADWLVERAGEASLLAFFSLGGDEAAFNEAFGMTLDEFHIAFEEHRLEVAPPFE